MIVQGSDSDAGPLLKLSLDQATLKTQIDQLYSIDVIDNTHLMINARKTDKTLIALVCDYTKDQDKGIILGNCNQISNPSAGSESSLMRYDELSQKFLSFSTQTWYLGTCDLSLNDYSLSGCQKSRRKFQAGFSNGTLLELDTF